MRNRTSTRYYRRLASFSRVIHFDPRGIGRSDPLDSAHPNTVTTRSNDAVAVLDAAGSERAAVVVWSGGGPIGIEFAARYPERVSALVLGDTYARLAAAADYPDGVAPEIIELFVRDNPDPDVEWSVGGADDIVLFAPTLANNVRYREWMQRTSRRSASPASARSYLTMTSGADVRDLLSQIQVPTLVLHRTRNRFTPPALGRYLAEHIPGAKLVDGAGTRPDRVVRRPGSLLDEIEEFLTGHRHGSADRVLTTVLLHGHRGLDTTRGGHG